MGVLRGLYPREGRRAGQSHPLTAVPAPHAVPTHPGPEARIPWGHREAPPRGLQEQREPRMGGHTRHGGTRTRGAAWGAPHTHAPHTPAPQPECTAGRGCSFTARFGVHPAAGCPARVCHRPARCGGALEAATDPQLPAASLEGVRGKLGPGHGGQSVGCGTGSPGS